MRDDREWLADISEAIDSIEKYALRGRDAFLQEELIQVWMRYHFQVMGEAARNISGHVKNKYPDIPWSAMIGFRNILIHHYFGIEPEVVWDIITQDLPPLKEQLVAILQQEGERG